MKTGTRNTALALVGLAALTIYILACTSFSPDDTKVLYPALDPVSGNVGMAVYDRETHRSDLAFVPIIPDKQAAVRAQWLDNRRILVTWVTETLDEVMQAAVVPWGERGPVRTFALTDIHEAAVKLSVPPPVAGDCLFSVDSSNRPVRLNLRSGEITRGQAGAEGELTLYADPAGRSVFFIESQTAHEANRFGQLNPETLERKPLMTIPDEVAEMSFFAFDPQGKRVAFVDGNGEARRVVVLENGTQAFTRPLPKAHTLQFGSGLLSPKGDTVWASYMKQATATNVADYGFMEIPLDSRPIRETVLLPAVQGKDDESVLYLQAGVAHDGSAAALASTYLALAADKFKPEDCALFLVDLKDPNRKVTRVPIPMTATNAPKMWK